MTRANLEITALAAGGDGVARADGLVVLTPRTAPGDVVEADVRVQGRVGRGKVVRLIRASAARVAPRCAHYEAPDRCGGCQWQHVDLATQREAKARIVFDAFARIAKREIAMPPIDGGEPWRYRRALTLAIRRVEGRAWAGLRAFDDPESVFSLDDCWIAEERLVATWRRVLGAERHLPAGPRLRGTVRWLDDRPQLVLEGGDDWPALGEFLAAVPELSAVWWQAEGRRRRLVADRRAAGTPGAAFAQVNAEVTALLQAHLLSLVQGHAPTTLIDAYSGVGDLAALLASAGVRVTAVELDAEASAHAAARLAPPSRAITGRVEEVITRLLPVDLVLLNPPRAGVDARVTAALAEAPVRPRAIIYVSCDPSTLARDVARLVGWKVQSLRCFDMFPQTAHVESVCELVPDVA